VKDDLVCVSCDRNSACSDNLENHKSLSSRETRFMMMFEDVLARTDGTDWQTTTLSHYYVLPYRRAYRN
jgi:hypothetical protein